MRGEGVSSRRSFFKNIITAMVAAPAVISAKPEPEKIIGVAGQGFVAVSDEATANEMVADGWKIAGKDIEFERDGVKGEFPFFLLERENILLVTKK